MSEDSNQDLEPQNNEEEFEEDYFPEDSPLWERLLGPCAIALSILALIAGIMAVMIQFEEELRTRVVVASPPDNEQEEEPEMDIEEQPVEIPTEETNEIIQKDVQVAEENETEDEEDFQETQGDPENASMVDFDNQSTLDTLGVGGGGGGRHGRRGGRRNAVKSMGGGRRTENAVLAALQWLKRHQSPNGSWDLVNYQKECGKEGKRGKCDGFGLSEYNVGGTGLALLAYTGRGYDHLTTGEFRKTIEKAMKFLKKSQQENGAFGEEKGNFLYNQSLATFALADLVAMSEDESLKPVVKKGIDYLIAAQNPGLAWRYANYQVHPELIQEHMLDGGAINDTSVTTWVVMALKTAKDIGIEIDPKSFEGASKWLDQVYDGEGYDSPGTFGYTKKKGFVYGRPYGTTACGMLSRQFMNQTQGLASGALTLLTELPDWNDGVRDMYYWYYGSLAMFQIGGDDWIQWNEAMKPALTKSIYNKTRDCLYGSWEPTGTSWGGEYGGRVYSTAIGALTLEVYYRYLRINEKQ